MFPWSSLFLLVLGLALIIKGADIFTEVAVWFAKKSGIPQVLIGITIVSLATTLPEFSVSVMASYSGYTSMAFGNAIGSCIANIGLILGIVLLIKSFKINREDIIFRGAYLIVVAVFLLVMSINLSITRLNGFLLIVLLLGFIYFIYKELSSLNLKDKPKEFVEDRKISFQITLFFISAIMIFIGANLIVNSGVTMAEYFGVPEIIISLTLIALGTSLPELTTAVTAAVKGHQDLSIGNVIGANLLNLTWVIGVSSIVRPITIDYQNLLFDLPIMVLLTFLLVSFALFRKEIGKKEGFVFLFIYVFFIIYTII